MSRVLSNLMDGALQLNTWRQSSCLRSTSCWNDFQLQLVTYDAPSSCICKRYRPKIAKTHQSKRVQRRRQRRRRRRRRGQEQEQAQEQEQEQDQDPQRRGAKVMQISLRLASVIGSRMGSVRGMVGGWRWKRRRGRAEAQTALTCVVYAVPCVCAVCVDALPASALGESSCNAADAANNTRQPQAAAAAAAALAASNTSSSIKWRQRQRCETVSQGTGAEGASHWARRLGTRPSPSQKEATKTATTTTHDRITATSRQKYQKELLPSRCCCCCFCLFFFVAFTLPLLLLLFIVFTFSQATPTSASASAPAPDDVDVVVVCFSRCHGAMTTSFWGVYECECASVRLCVCVPHTHVPFAVVAVVVACCSSNTAKVQCIYMRSLSMAFYSCSSAG